MPGEYVKVTNYEDAEFVLTTYTGDRMFDADVDLRYVAGGLRLGFPVYIYIRPGLDLRTTDRLDRVQDLTEVHLSRRQAFSKCECGAHVANIPWHSDWCPKYERY